MYTDGRNGQDAANKMADEFGALSQGELPDGSSYDLGIHGTLLAGDNWIISSPDAEYVAKGLRGAIIQY